MTITSLAFTTMKTRNKTEQKRQQNAESHCVERNSVRSSVVVIIDRPISIKLPQSLYPPDVSATGRGPPQRDEKRFVGAQQPTIDADCERRRGVCERNAALVKRALPVQRVRVCVCVFMNSLWICSFSVMRTWGKHWKRATSPQTTTSLWSRKALAQPRQVTSPPTPHPPPHHHRSSFEYVPHWHSAAACLDTVTTKQSWTVDCCLCVRIFYYLFLNSLNVPVPLTAPIEYENYYNRDLTADRNNSTGFVGGVMKRSGSHNAAVLTLDDRL